MNIIMNVNHAVQSQMIFFFIYLPYNIIMMLYFSRFVAVLRITSFKFC